MGGKLAPLPEGLIAIAPVPVNLAYSRPFVQYLYGFSQGLCVFGEGKAEEGKGRFGMATVVA